MGFDTRGQQIMDLPVHGKRVESGWSGAGTTAGLVPIPSRALPRMSAWMRKRSARCSASTWRNWNAPSILRPPAWLGMDKIHIFDKHWAVFTNLQQRTVINLLLNRTGRGYWFEELRAKMLLIRSLHKLKKPKYHTQNPVVCNLLYIHSVTRGFQRLKHELNYGVSG